jgi:uncharacterized protein GlcG (DUF336 family)
MHRPTKACVAVLVTLLVALSGGGRARGQHDDHAGGASAEKLGKVHFETSCAEAVGPEFDRAMALLHSFEFPEATAGFQKVLKADPTCGIAEWGIAMSTWGNPFAGLRAARTLQDGLAAAQRAQKVGAKTERERAYIAAVMLLYKDADRLDQRARTLAYERAMEQIYRKYPADREAAAFYALSVDQTAPPTDKTYANQLKAAAILEDLFKVEPEHPGITHYLIHSYDVPPLAPRGLVYARRYADLAPDAPHALHMPAHTFTRVGSWQESIDTNIRSRDAAVIRKNSGEVLHALDYMTYAYLQTAQDAAARKAVAELEAVIAGQFPQAPPAPQASGASAGPAGGFPAAAIPARYALERNQWADAAALTARPASQPYIEAMTHFARALGAARSGRPDAARPDIDRLAALRDKEIELKDEYWTTQVEIQRQSAEAWMSWAQGRKDEALKAMAAAAVLEDTTEKAAVTPGPLAPTRELLGEMLLEANQPAQALAEFEANLKKEPNRFKSVYGAGRAAELAGDRQKAQTYYAQLVTIAERGDRPGRRELEHARAFAAPAAAQAPQGRGGQPAPTGPAPASSVPTPGPTYVEAQKAIAAAHAAGAKLKVNLSCAVVDSRGDLIALGRMDGARFLTTDVARGKALTSAMFGQPSGAMATFGSSPFFQNLNTAAQGRLYPIQGALPIMRNNQVLGAIGCSGATAQQDEDAAKAGIAAMGGQ